MEAAVLSDPELDRGFLALADPTRRAILGLLARGDATVVELTRPFGISQPAVSKHLKVLEQAGLISRRKEAQRRPCRLEAQRLRALAEWVDGYREFWEDSYQRLDTYLDTLQERTDP